MESTVCIGCGYRVTPIKVFVQSAKSKQWWRVTKCPKESCGFNQDIVECNNPNDHKKPKDDRRTIWPDGF